ncbi:MAG TPA: hypothetical protein VKU19_38115 [Bryobacteraceae bacterium]|nr:hypothetical protein [Bryobacteraceae bacterium]
MSSLQIHHPEDDLLLRYIDGELPARKVRQVAHHLEACWQCRSEVEELQVTVADCVRYRKNVLQAYLPPPPSPWSDIYRGFAQVDESMRQDAWMSRLKQWLMAPAVWKWGVAVAASVVLAGVAIQQFRQAPSVHAATILRKAVSATKARPAVPRRVLVQTRTQRMVKVVGARQTDRSAESLSTSLEERFAAAHYDWNDPLSAQAYQGWFDGLPAKQDEVTMVADPKVPAESCYLLRTVTPDGSLAAASLMLRAKNLEPVESKLEFRDREWVEFTEIEDAAPGTGGRPATTGLEPAPSRGDSGSRAMSVPGSTASVADELQVLSALHDIGADLGDPVEVSLADGRVLVAGVGIPSQRQKRIHEALDGIPHVEIQFSEPSAAPLTAEPSVPDAAPVGPRTSPMQARVEQQVGGRAEFERFSAQVLERNERMMSWAYALRALAQRFPADQETGLSAQDRQVLRDIARDDANGLLRELSGMERALSPVLTAMGGSAGARPAANATAWESAGQSLFQASHRVEVLVSVVLGAAAHGDGSGDKLPSELLSAMQELHASVAQCQQLLGQ